MYVLDTWFSSALWPFSTLGWPNQTEDLKRYYPTCALVTGYDIIFFWVARMVFQGLSLTESRPFEHCLIHGLIRDAQGRKMSKSLGNGVDPMEVIDQYGADALRFFLTTNSAPGQDLRYIPEKIEASWNFINKIWNASRFVLMNIDEDFTYQDLNFEALSLVDQWILNRLNEVIQNVDDNMEKFEFVNVGTELYNFIWDDFCSWYIELSKVHLTGEDEQAKLATQSTLVYVLNAIVRMLHPFMPFVTEEIYQTIPHLEESICISSWPTVNEQFKFNQANEEVDYLIDLVKGIREIRAQYTIKNAKEIDYALQLTDLSLMPRFTPLFSYISKLCHATGMINLEEELAKLNKEKEKLESEIKRGENMLSNPNFVNKAPQAKVDIEKKKLADYRLKYDAILTQIEKMKKV